MPQNALNEVHNMCLAPLHS